MLGSFSTREARLYTKLEGGKVRCDLCERHCLIENSGRGFCKTRVNIEGKLYTTIYGNIPAISVNPIEKKPFFHYLPGSRALTFSSCSCNFSCPWCQNWEISRSLPEEMKFRYVDVDEMVRIAISKDCRSLSVSFNEPTLLFDYCVDLFPVARKNGLRANYVSNGYMSAEALEMLHKSGMDAIKFDMKGDSQIYKDFCDGAKVEVVWRNAKIAKSLGLHVEIVNLLIPGVNDDEDCIEWVIEEHLRNVGAETPLHFTRYYPNFEFRSPPTPVRSLEKAREAARVAGVLYPYIGNVPGHKFESTWCPVCGELLIKRQGFDVVKLNLVRGDECPNCGNKIPIVL
ncbi:MAG: AmmeMemoRadiSam system radical SAM enzyme [Thermoproteota archaeon]